MKSLEVLEAELSTSLSHADSMYHKNVADAIKKHETLLSYYSTLKTQMIEAAEKRFKEAKLRLEARPAKPSLTPGKRGRPSKLQQDIEDAKRRQRELLYSSTSVPLTRQQIQEQEEKKSEEIRAANISTVFNAFGFDEEDESPPADELDSDEERELQERLEREAHERAARKAAQQQKKEIIVQETITSSFTQEPKALMTPTLTSVSPAPKIAELPPARIKKPPKTVSRPILQKFGPSSLFSLPQDD